MVFTKRMPPGYSLFANDLTLSTTAEDIRDAILSRTGLDLTLDRIEVAENSYGTGAAETR